MKKIVYIFCSLFLMAFYAQAQGEIDALRFSRESLYGTARAMSMGGAFGALGGDQTGVSVNPAGIAVYRSSELAGTFGMSGETSSVGNLDARKNKFDADNFGFVGYFPVRSNAVPFINFGFSYNKLKSFDKNISATGNPNSRLIDYIEDVTNTWAGNVTLLDGGANQPDPFNRAGVPWLSILAYQSYLLDNVAGKDGTYAAANIPRNPVNQIHAWEKGYVIDYDFSLGTIINNVLNVGLALTVKNISYDLTSDYLEDFNDKGGYTLTNRLSVRGAGVGGKFGLIYRPVNSFRFGLAYHTPTWYTISENYEAQMDEDLGLHPNNQAVNSGSYPNDYDLKTPGKWVISMAGVLGSQFIASVDYELVNYKKMKLSAPSYSSDKSNAYSYDNEYISTDFKPASTVKVGVEYRFTPRFSGRLGYAWMQNPYDNTFAEKGNAGISSTNTVFRVEGDTNYFTGGFGYRFDRSFYMDMAVVYTTQTDDLYSFPRRYNDTTDTLIVDSTPFTLKNTSLRGLVTLGYRF